MSGVQLTEEEDIRQKLRELGLDPECDETEKIAALWRLYVKSEANLKASLSTVSELQSQQAEEMAEFEHYVEHVKSLSAEREALTAELAAENDTLKAENDTLRQEIDSYKNDETRDMLLQQGLEDIANGTASEQIAYLLVERARLMDELEITSQSGGAADLSTQRVMQMLEQERQEFEQELRQQRESMNRTRENLKASHEEEVTALMEENQHLQELLDNAKDKLNKATAQKQNSGNDSSNDKGSADYKRKLEELESSKEEELLSWKRRVRDVEHINQTLRDDVERTTTEMQREKTRLKGQLDEYEENDRKMRAERKEQEQQLRDIEVQNHKLTTEKKSMELKLNYMEKEIEDLRQKEQDLVSKNRSIHSAGQSSQSRELESLKQENQDLSDALERTKLDLRKEKENVLDLEFKVKRAETSLEDKQIDLERQEMHLKNKIKSLESQLSDLEDELAVSQKEAIHAKNDVKRGLEVSLSESEAQLKEAKAKLQEVTSSKADLQQEVDLLREQNASLRSQVDLSNNQVSRLENVKKQLDAENEEIATKLQDTKRDCVQKERDLLEERSKFKERYSDKENRLTQAQNDLDDLQREIRRVTSDLYSRDDQISQLEIRLESEKAQSQSSLAALRREIESLQRNHEAEVETLTQSLEKAQAENRKLRLTNTEKLKEIERLREEISNQALTDTLSFVNPEMASLNKDMSPAKLKEFYKRSAEMEAAMERLREELDKKNIELSEVRMELSELRGERNAETLIAQTRADTAEKKSQAEYEAKLYALQAELSRMREGEKGSIEVTEIKTELRLKKEEVTTLRNQLQEEKFKNMKTNSDAQETSHQVASLRKRETELIARNSELQRLLVDVEARLEEVRRQTRTNAGMRTDVDADTRSLQARCDQLQSEADGLRVELLKASDRYDKQVQKYSERRNRTKVKLQKARDVYSAEKVKLRQEIERLERDLSVARTTMSKDMEWRESIDTRHHSLLQEKRGLLTQLTEQDEMVRDHSRQLSVLQVRCRFLEDENNTLQQRVDSLVRQKQNLDRIIKEYQFERHKEEIRKIMTLNTSVLLSPRSFVASVNPATSYDRKLTGSTSNLLTSSGEFSTISSHPKLPADQNANSLEAIVSPRVNAKLRNFTPQGRLNQTMPTLQDSHTELDKNNDNNNTENDLTYDFDEDSIHM